MKIELEGAEQQIPKMEPVPFAEAIAWAESRGVVLPHVYYGELQGLARAAAFSIAGIAQLDQLQMVRDSLAEWTRDGGTYREWLRKVEGGEISLELPRHRLENIYRTNLQNHYGRGRCEQQARNVNTRPWFLYDAVNDSRTRPSHAAMDGVVARYDDPLWQKWTPPAGYQCRCRRIALSDRQAERYIEADRNRLAKYPEIAEARSTAQPDPGWDYSICGDAPPAQPGEISQATRQAQDGIAPAPMTGIDRAVTRKLADPRYPMPMREELARKHVRAIDEASEEPVLVQEEIRLPGYSLPVDRLAIRYARNTIRHKRITKAQRSAFDALPLEQRQYVERLIAEGLIG